MTNRPARERAEEKLTEALAVGGYGHAQATAITGVGWAVLDLADALRETRRTADADTYYVVPNRCPDCGPGYKVGDDGCSHTPTTQGDPA